MKTHYVRVKRDSQTLTSPIESVLVDSIPIDEILTMEQIYNRFERNCQKHSERCPTFSGTNGLLKSLCQNGFVKELNGVALDKFIDKL